MDPQASHTMALLHDIGRRYGATGMRHVVDGYRYLLELGFEQAALENRAYFDKRTGGSVYRLLPGIVENTFGFTESASLNC